MKKSIITFTFLILIIPSLIVGHLSNIDPTRDQQLQVSQFGFSKIVDLSFEETLKKVKDLLKKEGFGILTEVDVQATMKKKLDIDFRPYHILGVCNPPLAHKALQSEEQIGLMLPCKFIVYVNEDKKTVVAAVDPVKMMGGIENEQLAKVAQAVQETFKKVLTTI